MDSQHEAMIEAEAQEEERLGLMQSLIQSQPLPPIPATFMDTNRAAKIFFGQMKKKLQRQFGGMFSEIRDEFRKEIGLTEEEAREASLYAIQMSRIAMNEIFDELEKRAKKQ